MSFFRSVMTRAPASSRPNVAGVEPALVQHRGFGGLGLVPVAVHDEAAADEHLAIGGDAKVHARQRGADRVVAGLAGQVDADDGPASVWP